MGIPTLRDDSERILKKNFPDSIYLKGDPRRDKVPWWQIWNY
jgi:outer membrane protein assembly factor BamD